MRTNPPTFSRRFFRDHAGVPLRRRRAEPAKFLAVKDYTFIADDITEDHGAGEMADGQTIARRSIVQMIGGDELPGAWHVLHDNARIAGQMFADVARQHAAVGIESPAGSGADEHHDGFASEEFLGRGWSNSRQNQCRREDDLYTAPNCETRRASLSVRCGACRIISHGLLACEVRLRPTSHRRSPSALAFFARPSPAGKRARGRCSEIHE